MLKNLVILTALGAFLSGWPCVAKDQQGKPNAQPNQPDQSQNIVSPTRAIVEPSSATVHGKYEPEDGKETAKEKSLPTHAGPEWVIVYITAAYVVISGLILLSNKKQGRLMKLQLEQMQRQTDWILAKERPKLSMRLEPFDPFNNRSGSGSYVRGTISIRGNADATILRTAICVSPDRHAISAPFEFFDRRIQPTNLRLTLDNIDEILPTVPAGTPPIPFIAMVYREGKRAVADEDIASITRGKTKLYCKAVIEFSDPLGLLPPLCIKQFFEFVCTPISSGDVLRYGHWKQWGEYSDSSQDSEYPEA